MIGILIFGLVGFRLLPVSQLPNVDFPTIQVTAEVPGASPETMGASVAGPIMKAVMQAALPPGSVQQPCGVPGLPTSAFTGH